MNTPAGSILLALSLLLLLASLLCLATAAARARRPESGPEPHPEPDDPARAQRRTRTRRRTLAATLVSALTAVLLPISAPAHACVSTGIGVCIQTAPQVQIPTKINLGSQNLNLPQIKPYVPPKPTLPKITVPDITPFVPQKENQALPLIKPFVPPSPKSAPAGKSQTQTNTTNNNTNTTSQVKYTTSTKTTPPAKTSTTNKNKQTSGSVHTVTTVTSKGQAKTQTHTKTKTTTYHQTTPLVIPVTATPTPAAHAKNKKKQYSGLPIVTTPSTKATPPAKPKPGALPGIDGPIVITPTPTPPADIPPIDGPPITLPQTCQLTEAEQQQLLDEAMAQHAANEALYQQLLLKALLQQAALKAGSAMLTQQLSGHTGLSPQDVADLIKNGAVNPADIAMAALQAAHELDQETGGHSSQNTGTTCAQNQDPQAPPAAAPAQNNPDPNAGNNPGGQNQQQGGQNQGGKDPNNTPANLPAYVWTNPRPGVDTDPQDPLPPGTELLKPGEPLQEGTYYYVVKTDGSLQAAHEDVMFDDAAGRYSGHTNLSGGQDVLMAGTFTVDDQGEITAFDNGSGHYQPGSKAPAYTADPSKYASLEGIARQAFADFGLPDPGANAWDPYGWKN